jgi:cytochrome c-type biogenesis protein
LNFEAITFGPLWVAAPIALLAGLVSFFSPCVLPLLPAYLGIVSGSANTKSRMITGALLFVAGFSIVFVALGAGFGGLGSIFSGEVKNWLQRGSGVLVLVLGIILLGGFDFAQRTAKLNIKPRAGLIGAPILGIVFGLGWTPCIGPTLAAVLNLAFDTGSVGRGAFLAAVYSIGLGLPFVLAAAGFSWAAKSISFIKKNMKAINITGGVLLIVLGVLLITGLWQLVIDYISEVSGVFIPAI